VREPLRLRAATFNIHGGRPLVGPADLKATAEVLRGIAPDVAALQEVHRRLPPPYVFQDQPRRLRELLDMHVAFRRSFGFGPAGYGNALLSRVEPRRVLRIRLPDGKEPRAVVQADFEIEGRAIRFMGTHLGLTPEERASQARRIAGQVRDLDVPVIAAGDWNDTPDSETFRILEEAGLRRAGTGDLLTYPCDHPECCLDGILTSSHFTVERVLAVPTQVSDHLPVFADLVLP
jgi:endonuclease/exonuclease/phosphatase family metal-dependent hydrolase